MTDDDASGEERSGGSPSGTDDCRSDASPEDIALYAGSDGQFYSGWQLGRRLASDEWRPCVRDRVADRRLVQTDEGGLLMLERTSFEALPAWAEARSDGSAVRIVDTRRVLPPG